MAGDDEFDNSGTDTVSEIGGRSRAMRFEEDAGVRPVGYCIAIRLEDASIMQHGRARRVKY